MFLGFFFVFTEKTDGLLGKIGTKGKTGDQKKVIGYRPIFIPQ